MYKGILASAVGVILEFVVSGGQDCLNLVPKRSWQHHKTAALPLSSVAPTFLQRNIQVLSYPGIERGAGLLC